MSVVRWQFRDVVTNETITLPLNPNQMSSPTTPRNMTWAWGTKVGVSRMRGFEGPPDTPAQWTFGGVILTKAHYDLLLDWSGRLSILRIEDHLGRRFRVIIQKFDPIERLPSATKPWRVDYTMTTMLLERVPDA